MWAVSSYLGAPVGCLGALVGTFGKGSKAFVSNLEQSWAVLEPLWAVFGRSWGLCGRSGAEKCEERAYLENVSISRAGARSAAWGRSWAALGAHVGGLEPLLELM